MMKGNSSSLLVLSGVDVTSLQRDDEGCPILSEADRRKDDMDNFNKTRRRRALILSALVERRRRGELDAAFECPSEEQVASADLNAYEAVHSEGLLQFLMTAWDRWNLLGEGGRDPLGYLEGSSREGTPPPFVPPNIPLPRDDVRQVASQHVLGQIGYYCTDTCTPMFQDVREELLSDAALVHRAITFTVDQQSSCTTTTVVYLIPTHPGHHAARDSFGGYCYLNHAAAIAQSSSTRQAGMQRKKIAILDVDYHCGNGTASIFYDDPSVLVVSIHCDPNHEYPFHSGYEHQTGVDKGKNTTLHIPLPPGTGWSEYRVALEKGLAAIQEFGAEMVVISLGLDTYDKDPCAIRRAGFHLRGFDYVEMGETIAKGLARTVPVVFVQEGGYRMDKIGEAAADVVASFCEHRS